MSTSKLMLGSLAVAAVIAGAPLASSQAETLVALAGARSLLTIDADEPRLLSVVKVTGIDTRIVGIDVRPANGMLYGLTNNGKIYTIDPVSGEATLQSQLATPLPAGFQAMVDFNPVPDRMRVIGTDGTNLRINVDTGAVIVDTNVSFAPPVPNAFGGTTPRVLAGAYSNNRAGARATVLWDIDDATDALYIQIPPNDGVLNTIGNPLGITLSPTVGFDIATDADGINRAWLINGTMLYDVDLPSGLAVNPRSVTFLRGPVRDLAVLPDPAS